MVGSYLPRLVTAEVIWDHFSCEKNKLTQYSLWTKIFLSSWLIEPVMRAARNVRQRLLRDKIPSCASVTSSGITSNMPVYRKLSTTPLGKATISTGSVLFATGKSWAWVLFYLNLQTKKKEKLRKWLKRERSYALWVCAEMITRRKPRCDSLLQVPGLTLGHILTQSQSKRKRSKCGEEGQNKTNCMKGNYVIRNHVAVSETIQWFKRGWRNCLRSARCTKVEFDPGADNELLTLINILKMDFR